MDSLEALKPGSRSGDVAVWDVVLCDVGKVGESVVGLAYFVWVRGVGCGVFWWWGEDVM